MLPKLSSNMRSLDQDQLETLLHHHNKITGP
jgi:hypothetical protein